MKYQDGSGVKLNFKHTKARGNYVFLTCEIQIL